MKFSERKKMMEDFNPDQLLGAGKDAAKAEAYYRWHVIQLMADIADQVGTMAYAYQEMLKIQQAKSHPPQPKTQTNVGPVPAANPNPHRMEGIPPVEQSRYGNNRTGGK